MEFLPEESVAGKYDVYRHESGEKYIVLEGLDPQQIHEPGTLETFMHEHYNTFEVFYWLLLLATLVYVIGKFLITPLYCRYVKKS